MKTSFAKLSRLLVVILLTSAFTYGATGNSSKVKFRKVEYSRSIKGEYIVVFKDSVQESEIDEVVSRLNKRHGGVSMRIYKRALKGFSVKLTEAAAIELSANADVEFVEENARGAAFTVQNNAPWGLDRIDQVDGYLSSLVTKLNQQYDDRNLTGSGVNVYVMDSGIRTTHHDFGGRASAAGGSTSSLGADFINDGFNGQDGYGHGTHVAAIIGGTTYGVAKQARLYSVRVLDTLGNTNVATVIAGVDWVTSHHIGPSVVNMSLGTSVSTSLDTAVRNSIAAGIVYVVAAGNSYFDVSFVSPAGVSETICVGSMDKTDTRALDSNTGLGIDLFAPGVSILSAWNNSDTGYNTISGTSMAAPHVCGMVARYLQTNPGASPAAVQEYLVSTTIREAVDPQGTHAFQRIACTVHPMFTLHPIGKAVDAGGAITFTATVVQAEEYTSFGPNFVWKKNGIAIPGTRTTPHTPVSNSTYSIAKVGADDAGNYTVTADDTFFSVTSNVATLTVNNVAPTITTQPISQTTAIGGSVIFTVAASGLPEPSFQWKKDGVNILGATSTALTITSAVSESGGVYTVLVSNSVGSVTSVGATLTVNPATDAPIFTIQPVSHVVPVGGSVTFITASSGSPAPTFQWKKDGADIFGATSASYTIANVVSADAGLYSAVASNSIGSAISNNALLTVIVAPSGAIITFTIE